MQLEWKEVAGCRGTTTAEFLFDFNELPVCENADSIGQSVNRHMYKCPIQSVSHILLPYIYVCLQLLVL